VAVPAESARRRIVRVASLCGSALHFGQRLVSKLLKRKVERHIRLLTMRTILSMSVPAAFAIASALAEAEGLSSERAG
jgi:hypothetical protein